MTTTIVISILIVISVFLLIRGFVLIKRMESMEDIIVRYEEQQDMTVEVLERMLQQMRELDLRGSFESDDEVGSVFGELKDLIEQYKQLIDNA